jgi:hypothetical protein
MMAFCERYADWPDNVGRVRRINGPRSVEARTPDHKAPGSLIKAGLALLDLSSQLMSISAAVLERVAPQSRSF